MDESENSINVRQAKCDRTPEDLALIVLSGTAYYNTQEAKIEIVVRNGLIVFRDILSGLEIKLDASHLIWAINSLETAPDGIDRSYINLCATIKGFKDESGATLLLGRCSNCLIIACLIEPYFAPDELIRIDFKNFRLGFEFLLSCDRTPEEWRAAR